MRCERNIWPTLSASLFIFVLFNLQVISEDRLMRSLEAMRQPAEQEERQEPAAEEGTNAHLSIYYPYDQF